MTQLALRMADTGGDVEVMPRDVCPLGAANIFGPDLGGSSASLIENNDRTMPLPFCSCGG